MLRAFDPFSSRADHLDCPHSHSLGTDEQMGLLAVWQSLRCQCCPHGGHLALVHAMVFHSGRLGWHSPHWYTWADSYMPWVGSAPPCGDQVPTWGQGPCTITWWREVTLMASLGAGVALVSPVGDWHAVWHVGTRLHAAHRQSFADRLITWIACAHSTSCLLCRGACCPVAAAAAWLAPSAWLVWRFVSTRLHCGVMS